MLVRFLQNLGSDDTRACKLKFNVDIDYKKCLIGEVVEIPDEAAEALAKKYPALFEPAKVRGVAKQSEITAPAK